MTAPPPASAWPPGDSEMAQRIRAHDWAATPLGPIVGWPQSLRTAVDLCLSSAVPSYVWWGPERTQLYNDAALQINRSKHPAFLGQPAREAWADVWEEVGGLFAHVMATGESVRGDDLPMVPDRGGPPETAWFTFSYGPCRDETGAVSGIFCTAIETTARIRAEASLRATEERYRALFNAMDEGYARYRIVAGVDGAPRDMEIVEVNPAYERLMQRSAPVGKRLREIEPAVDQEWLDALASVADSGLSQRFERYNVRLDRWFDVHVTPGSEDPAVVVLIFSDITGRKRREANLAFLAEISQDLARLTNIDETMNDLGKKLAAYFGLAACAFAELRNDASIGVISHDWHRADMPSLLGTYVMAEWVSPEVLQQCRVGEAVVIHDVFADPRTDGEQYARMHIGSFVSMPLVRDGEWRFLLVVYRSAPSQWRDDDISLLRELTSRIWTRLESARAEEAMRGSEARYRLLFTSIDTGFCTIEVLFGDEGEPIDYRFLEANPAFETTTGLTDVIGRRMRDLAPAHEPYWFEIYGRIVRTQAPERFEAEAAALGRWYNVYAFPTGDPARRQVSILFEDITGRKTHERQQAFILQVADALRSLTSAVAIEQTACRLLGEYLETDRAYYVELDHERQRATVVRDFVRGATPSLAGHHAFAACAPVFATMQGGRPFIATDTTTDPRISENDRPAYAALAMRSFISMPIINAGTLVAAVCVTNAFDRAWTDDEVSLLGEVAGRTWDAVARARSEEALQVSEARFRTFAENASDTLWIVDADRGRLEYLSPAFERMWGEPRDAVMGDLDRWRELVHPDDRERASQAMQQIVTSAATPLVNEYRIVRQSDGATRWIYDTGFTIHDSAGVVHRVGGIAQDITARKQAETALLESERRYRFIVDQAADYAIFSTDPDRRIETWSPGAERAFGWSADEAVGQLMDITYTPEDQASGHVEREVATAHAAGSAANVRWHQRKDGQRVFIEGTTYARHTDNGEFQGVFKVGQDVTARRLMEEALRQSEALLGTVLQTAPVAIGFFDDRGQILLSNPAMQRYFPTGMIPSRDPAHVSRWEAFDDDGQPISPDDFPGSRALLGLPTIPGMEMRFRLEDGRRVWTRVASMPIQDELGGIRRQVAVITDIDDLKRTEATLRESEASLQRRVLAATAELRTLSRRLLTVQEEERRHLARELHDEIGQVLTGLNFQLGAAARSQAADLADAQATVQRLTEQVRQLSMDLRPEMLDRYGVLPSLEWLIERYQQRTGIAVTLRHMGLDRRFPPEVEITAYRVVQEALTNVARHAATNAVSVQILGDGTLLIVVRDEGQGFRDAQTYATSGLGGMRERVALLGGTLDIESAPGEGTVVTAELPVDAPLAEHVP